MGKYSFYQPCSNTLWSRIGHQSPNTTGNKIQSSGKIARSKRKCECNETEEIEVQWIEATVKSSESKNRVCVSNRI